MTPAKLLHIHTAPRSGRPMVPQDTALAVAGQGIEGDRYTAGTGKFSRVPGEREVTLFPIETIQYLQEEHGLELLVHEHRRNLTTQGIEPGALIGRTFTVGEVTLVGLRPCQPCRYLNMMSKKQISTRLTDRAGLYCRVVTGGTLKLGDAISLVE